MKCELSKENIDKLVFGGIYKVDIDKISTYLPSYKEGLNDQKYYIWVPVHAITDDWETKEKHDTFFMIDTYQISRDLYNNPYSYNKEEILNGIIEGLESTRAPNNHGNWASRMPYNYHYSAKVELTDENFNIFTLIADLRDYRIADYDEIREFKEEDILKHIRLYFEHACSTSGIAMVKKDACINYENKINALISDINKNIELPYASSNYSIQELLNIEKEAIEKGQEYDKENLDRIIKKNKFISNLRELYNSYYDELNGVIK